MKRVVIAGAGISGLALAWALRRQGVSVRIFESEARPGGKLRSDRIDGYLVEAGPQSFGFRDPAAWALVEQLDLEEELVHASSAARRRGVVADGRFQQVPTSPLAFARSGTVPPAAKARVLLDLALPRGPAGRGEDESVAEFGRRHFGERGAERFLFPLISGLYTGDPEVLSLRSAFPRLADLERDHRSLLLGALSDIQEAALGPKLATFRDGMGTLPTALARELGADLWLGTPVVGLRPHQSGWRVTVQERSGRTEVDADAVALTVPSHAAGALLEGVDAGLAAVVGRISYAPLAIAYLGYRRADVPQLPQAYGFYTPSSETCALLGAVFSSELFPGNAPREHRLIACRMGGSRDPDLLARTDDDLAHRAHLELVRLLGARREPVFRRVVRHPRALPQYTLGHQEKVAAIDAAVARHPGLFLSGNAYRGLGILECVRQAPPLGRRIAEHLSWPFPPSPLENQGQM